MTERSEQIQIMYEIVTSLDTELDLQDMLKKCLSIYVRKLNCSAGAVFKLNQYSQGENYYLKEIVSMPRRIHNNSAYKDAIKQIPQESNKQILNEFYKHLPTNLHISENQHCHIMNLPGFGLIIFLKGGEPLKVDLLNSLLSLNKEIADACKSCLNIEALRGSEEKYRTVFENTGTAMIIIEEDKTIFMTNTQFEKLSGYSKEEIENKMKWIEFIFPEDLKIMEKYHSERRKAGSKVPAKYEFRLLDKKGNVKDIFLKIRMIPGTKKSVASLMDITERKKAEEALSEAHNIINRSAVVAFLWKNEVDWPVEFVSENVKKLTGYSAQEFLEKKISYINIIYSNDLERVAGEVASYSKKEGLQTFVHKPYRIITKNGNIKWINDITYIRRDSRGIITHYEGIVYDVTEHKQLEESILKSEEKYRLLADNSIDVIWQVNLKLVFTYVSPSIKNIMGYTVDEWVGTRLSQHASTKEFFNMAKKALYAIKNYKKFKYLIFNAVMLRKDGTKIPVEINGKLLLNKKGLPIGLQGTTRDITERKQAEEKINHLNLVLHAIRNVNELIVKVKDRERLLKGACENLVKTRGYHNTWIALLDEEGKLKTCAEAGLGKSFLPMIELFEKGKMIICSQKALKQQEVIVTENPASTCTECPLAQKYSGEGAMTIRLEYNGKIYGLMSVSIPTHIAVDQEEKSLFKEVAEDIAFSLRNIELDKERKQAEEKLQETYQRLKKTMDASIETMSKILEAKDPYTAGHQQRVSQLATAIAKELNLSQNKIEGIKIASLIHDIGKIGLPTEILSKPTKLSDMEFNLIKNHSQIGHDILEKVDFLWPIAEIVLQHHEKINGSGYPGGLKGDEILLEAKIICVADVVEAMSSHRPYRPAKGIDAALNEIVKNKGIFYDSKVVEACIKSFKEKEFKL